VIIRINKDLLETTDEKRSPVSIGNIYPNPFSSNTTIPLEIRRTGRVTVEIMDIWGYKVRTLASQVFAPGSVTLQWDGTDMNGNRLPGGIYLCRLVSENSNETRRLVLIR
jgi:flagellar hook assembly protein FlgD